MSLDYRSIMSGRRKDPLAFVMRGALRLASMPYGVAVGLRNRRFDSGDTEIHRSGVPVISVGNLTTGGTGKTPIVCFLAKWFRQREIRVAIVSRGYGRGDTDANDEAMELHANLPDVPHVQDADRVAAARIAVEEFETQVILMDDGFQHRRLHRDLDLVVIDATCPFGFGYLLPRGLLRESLTGLRRADAVMISRCDSVSETELGEIELAVSNVNRAVPILRCAHEPKSLLEYPRDRVGIGELSGRSVAVISAIGNPDAFEATVRHCGATIAGARRLPDHDAYSPETVGQLAAWVQSLGDRVEQVICTHKDLVKLRTDRLGGRPLRALRIELNLQSETETLEKLLTGIMPV